MLQLHLLVFNKIGSVRIFFNTTSLRPHFTDVKLCFLFYSRYSLAFMCPIRAQCTLNHAYRGKNLLRLQQFHKIPLLILLQARLC